MQALSNAVELWSNPEKLIELWNGLDSKKQDEELIAKRLNHVRSVVDVGCGVGRYSKVLSFNDYYGFDSSTGMIKAARELNNKANVQFSCVDILNYSNDKEYDQLICVDVAHHYDQPVEFIDRILTVWNAKYYLFTLLVGDKREELYNSTVVPFTDLLLLTDKYNFPYTYIRRFDQNQFAWVMLES